MLQEITTEIYFDTVSVSSPPERKTPPKAKAISYPREVGFSITDVMGRAFGQLRLSPDEALLIAAALERAALATRRVIAADLAGQVKAAEDGTKEAA